MLGVDFQRPICGFGNPLFCLILEFGRSLFVFELTFSIFVEDRMRLEIKISETSFDILFSSHLSLSLLKENPAAGRWGLPNIKHILWALNKLN